RATKRAPYEPKILYSLFLCLQQQGRDEEAKAVRRRWKKCEGDLARLAKVSRQIATTPHDPELRLRAARLCLDNGQEEAGLNWLRSALKEKSDHAPTHRALADYYEKKGRPDLARRHRSLATASPAKP